MYPVGIVVYDPRHRLLDGTVVEGHANVRRASDDGVVLLPYDQDLAGERLGGHVRVGWGEGVRLADPRGARVCPMAVRVGPEREFLYWAAVVVADQPSVVASFRMLSNPGASDTSVNLAAVDGDSEFSVRLARAGEVARILGRRRVSAVDDGYLALDLFAAGAGASVLVTAATQSRIDAHGL
jgi:hypothetical protein